MKSCLIKTNGFFGDILFATSVADSLKRENQYDKVDMLIGFPQMYGFVSRNPNVDDVYTSIAPTPIPSNPYINEANYAAIFQLPGLTHTKLPTVEYQEFCGVKEPQLGFTVYTDPEVDAQIEVYFRNQRRPVVAVMNGWEEKAFLFTKEEYWKGVNIPYKGYGGKLRNIPYIIGTLAYHQYNMVLVGAPHLKQADASVESRNTLENMVSAIKFADCFIGPEGGLANFAGGVGTKCLLEMSFVWQLYGPNGLFKKLEDPQLGPHKFFPNAGHVAFDPFLDDIDLTKAIMKEIDNLGIKDE